MTENAVRALDTRLAEFETLLTTLEVKTSAKFIKIEKHDQLIIELQKEFNELKREVATQPLGRVREISAFADNAHSKIRENLDLIIDLKESVYKEFSDSEDRIKEEVKKDVMSKLTIASVFVGIIFTLVSVIYYDARTDLNELKTQISKK